MRISPPRLTHLLTCDADQINASWACENDRMLNQILKGEVGFQGYVQSDWGAHHSTLAAVNGLDVSPSPHMSPDIR